MERVLGFVIVVAIAAAIPLGYSKAAHAVSERWHIPMREGPWWLGAVATALGLILLGVPGGAHAGVLVLTALVSLIVGVQFRTRRRTRSFF